VTLSPLCQLDLGASAKAMVADLVATDVGESGGVVVEIGGDVACAPRTDPNRGHRHRRDPRGERA